MKSALKIALFFAFSWIGVKLAFFYLDWFQEDIFVTGLINNFFLLAAIALGLYAEKKKEGFGKGSAFSDIKSAMVAAAPYAVIVSVFMFFYYRDINPNFTERKLTERMDIVYSAMERESYVDSLKLQNRDFNVMSNDEIYVHIRQEMASAYAPSSLLTFSLLGLMVLGMTYSIFVTLIFRKILFRDFYGNKEND